MTGWAAWCLIGWYSITLARVETNKLDFLQRFRTNLANFENLDINTNSLSNLANVEAAEACQDATNANKVY